ncbi:hypothetical protein D1227_07560 [Henriciella mobilis]|uniref:ribonuclease E/G n=1 Tax=Henriciella mobilis TaxID=2305467 RepID=UPI000E65EFFC|nr:ribonuclease E/G [Henriciella mobilis]RIJ16443.1 hypothetical protein D1231_08200 [Henriciella mobilis]RIJ22604.1 hypothetical protein D1227_07560 [Henriciella mobilis]
MSISRIVLNEAPGEIRAAAFDEAGQAVRLFLQRWSGDGQPVRAGEIVSARLRQSDAKDGGAFFETASGERIFVRGDVPKGLSEGAETTLEIRAEARHGKLARGAFSKQDPTPAFDAFAAWLDELPGKPPKPETAADAEDLDAIEAAFDEALAPAVGLARGGLIRLDRTAALIAIDIDSAGRNRKGSAAARALSINKEAVETAARQVALRDWGGLLVIDCLAPLTAEARTQLRDAFLAAFQSVSARKVEALNPSRFGLLEAKIAWGASPIEDRLLDETGQKTADTELLDLFRDAARQAAADRTAFFRLTLSPRALKAYNARRNDCDAILNSACSGRVSIASGTGEQSVVRRA